MNDSGFASLLGLESGIRSVGVKKGLRLEDEGFVDAGYRRRGLGTSSGLRDLSADYFFKSSVIIAATTFPSGFFEI